jgi:hypothetical protein
MIEKVTGQVVYAVIAFHKSVHFGAGDHTLLGKMTYDTRLTGYRTDITESE